MHRRPHLWLALLLLASAGAAASPSCGDFEKLAYDLYGPKGKKGTNWDSPGSEGEPQFFYRQGAFEELLVKDGNLIHSNRREGKSLPCFGEFQAGVALPIPGAAGMKTSRRPYIPGNEPLESCSFREEGMENAKFTIQGFYAGGRSLEGKQRDYFAVGMLSGLPSGHNELECVPGWPVVIRLDDLKTYANPPAAQAAGTGSWMSYLNWFGSKAPVPAAAEYPGSGHKTMPIKSESAGSGADTNAERARAD